MKRFLFSFIISLCVSCGCFAQDFFDDKKLNSPVPHMSRYNNDFWHLTDISRNPSGTYLKVRYKRPYASRGWVNIPKTTCLMDEESGKLYPLIVSNGIPKEPEKYVWEQEATNVDIPVELMFPPIPASVKKVKLSETGLYNIDLEKVPTNAEISNLKFFNDKTNSAGTLSLDALVSNAEYTYMYFSYQPTDSNNDTFKVSEATVLKDVESGKTYNLKYFYGFPKISEKIYVPFNSFVSNNEPLGFLLMFPSMVAEGVKTFDLISGDLTITGITN